MLKTYIFIDRFADHIICVSHMIWFLKCWKCANTFFKHDALQVTKRTLTTTIYTPCSLNMELQLMHRQCMSVIISNCLLHVTLVELHDTRRRSVAIDSKCIEILKPIHVSKIWTNYFKQDGGDITINKVVLHLLYWSKHTSCHVLYLRSNLLATMTFHLFPWQQIHVTASLCDQWYKPQLTLYICCAMCHWLNVSKWNFQT